VATLSALAPSHTPEHRRHQPEATLFYRVIEEYWPEFQVELAGHGKSLPAYITKEFEGYLKCSRLECGFLRIRWEACNDEKLVAFSGPLLRILALRSISASLHVIAFIEDPAVIKKILLHLEQIAGLQTIAHLPESRAPPQLA
jgi:hypothetical protein